MKKIIWIHIDNERSDEELDKIVQTIGYFCWHGGYCDHCFLLKDENVIEAQFSSWKRMGEVMDFVEQEFDLQIAMMSTGI